MKRNTVLLGLLSLSLVQAPVLANALVGQMAPAFEATDSNGKTHRLSGFKGKYVVLEWTNYDCPFVKRQYGTNTMQNLQKTATQQGVVWLSVNSSAMGNQGSFSAMQVNALMKEKGAAPTAYLMDNDGSLGKLYAAKTTPHMFIVDPQGKLVYNGAVDDKPTTDMTVKADKNYVQLALNDALAGRPIAEATTRPYGCSVKY